MTDFTQMREDRIRLSDLDFQQHVNNAALTALLANARFEFLGETVRPLLAAGSRLVLLKLEVEFMHEVVYGEPVFTGTRLLKLGTSSMGLQQALYQGNRCALVASSVMVHSIPGRPGGSPWPEALRALTLKSPTACAGTAPPPDETRRANPS